MYIIQSRTAGTLDEWRSDSIGEQNEFESYEAAESALDELIEKGDETWQSREYRIAWKGVAQ